MTTQETAHIVSSVEKLVHIPLDGKIIDGISAAKKIVHIVSVPDVSFDRRFLIALGRLFCEWQRAAEYIKEKKHQSDSPQQIENIITQTPSCADHTNIREKVVGLTQEIFEIDLQLANSTVKPPMDAEKITIHDQIHEAARAHSNSIIILDHFDDKKERVTDLWSYYTENLQLIPNNVILNLSHHAGNEITRLASLKGTRPINEPSKRINITLEIIKNHYLNTKLADDLKRFNSEPTPENKEILMASAQSLAEKISLYTATTNKKNITDYLISQLNDDVILDNLNAMDIIEKTAMELLYGQDKTPEEMQLIARVMKKIVWQQYYKYMEAEGKQILSDAEESKVASPAAVQKFINKFLENTKRITDQDNDPTPDEIEKYTQGYEKDFETYLQASQAQKDKPTTTTTLLEIVRTIINYIEKLIQKLVSPVRNKIINNSALFSANKEKAVSAAQNKTQEPFSPVDPFTAAATRVAVR